MPAPFAALLLLASSPAFTGDWVTADRSALVRIAPCGGTLCGRIVRVLARGVPITDAHNPDRAKRRAGVSHSVASHAGIRTVPCDAV
jgi:hypothetical protein